jgi:hypothetical protein
MKNILEFIRGSIREEDNNVSIDMVKSLKWQGFKTIFVLV